MIDKIAYIWALPHEGFEKMYKMLISDQIRSDQLLSRV